MGETVKLQAIVLNKTDYKENDRVLTLFSPEKGRVTVSAKGVKKQNSKLRAGSEVFAFGTYILNETRGRFTVTGYDSIEPFHELRDDFSRLSAAVLLLKMTDKACAPEKPDPELFTLLLRCLDKMRDEKFSPGFVISVFLLKFCDLFGYRPVTDSCCSCGKNDSLFAFSPEKGGMVCKDCDAGEHVPVTGGCLFYIKYILENDTDSAFLIKPVPKQIKELYHAVCFYTSYFFDEKIKIMDYIAKYDLV